MNRRPFLAPLSLLFASCLPLAASASGPRTSDAHLAQLNVSAGRWVYHGHFLGHGDSRPRSWTWHEDCRWSATHVFMLCSFSNTWAGRHVDSVVVDTYDPQKKTFWHYEIFNTGRAAGKPFAARMRIDGATRSEAWTRRRDGKVVHQRIVYEFAAGGKVSVSFQQSSDGTHWKTTATGTGEKIG